jgi:class 3 adenylate cyclase
MEEPPLIFDGNEMPAPVMAHVLFADIVGYSKLTTDEQTQLLRRVQQIVKSSPEFMRAVAANQLIRNPTGDGVALVFFDDMFAPMRCAVEIAERLRLDPTILLRMGLHSGYVHRIADINGKENVAGGGINIAQRVMDCGDAGHILVSNTHAQFLAEFGAWKQNLHDLGTAEVKHGVKIQLFNYFDAQIGNSRLPSKLGSSAPPVPAPLDGQATGKQARIGIIYKRGAQPDEDVVAALEQRLRARNYSVFIDRHIQVGLEWAKEIEREMRSADAVIPLLSPSAIESEMLAMELQIADDAAQAQHGKPRILPVRLNWEGPLPPQLATLLDPIQYVLWRGPENHDHVAAELVKALQKPEQAESVKRLGIEADKFGTSTGTLTGLEFSRG